MSTPPCSSCGNPDTVIGHGDGDLLCENCDLMRAQAEREEKLRISRWWTPERRLQLMRAMRAMGPSGPRGAPAIPRRVFR